MNGSSIFMVDGQCLVAEPVHNGEVRLWQRIGQTENARVLATADGASIDAVMYSVHVEDGLILLQHWNGGIQYRFHGAERIEPAAVTYDQVDPLFTDAAEGSTDE